MQRILDSYRSGIQIQGIAIKQADPPAAVNDAFKEVTAAQQEAQSYVNQSRAYALQLTAKARDKAGIARIELQIDGHRVQVRRASRVSYRWRQRPGRHRIAVVAFDKRGNRGVYQLILHLARA